MKTRLFHRIAILSISTMLFADIAFTAPLPGRDPVLEVRETLIRGGMVPAVLHVKITARPMSYYSLAYSTSETVWSQDDDSSVLGADATLVGTGQLDQRGSVELQFDIPAGITAPLIYLQTAVSRQRPAQNRSQLTARESALSSLKTVSVLQNLLPQISTVGAQGATGPTGPQGPKGDLGAVGPQGEMGQTGPQGLHGDVGPQGPMGPAGAQGLKGDAGAVGPQGPQGEIGPMGSQGPKGDPGPQGAVPQLGCPTGWIDLGPSCIEPDFNSFATLDQALSECFSMGAKLCGHQELAYACMHRTAYGINFPNNTWLHTGDLALRDMNVANSNYVSYQVYRRYGDRCFGPPNINPSDGVVSYDVFNVGRNYACCMAPMFNLAQ